MGSIVAGTTVASANTTYTVKSGDTLSEIAQTYATTVDAIAKTNSLSNINLIYVGDQLEIGSDATTTSTNQQSAPAAQTPAVTTQPASTTTATQNTTTNSAATTANSQSATTSTSSQSSNSNYGTGSHAAILNQMASRTGVSASTWSYIINRESNWQPYVRNSSSGAYGLFQNMHINGGSIQDQIDAAVSLYHQQGMAAWAL